MISYPETEQFRNVIVLVTKHARRFEENLNKPLPVMKFTGTVKLHGTNSAVGYQKDIGHWCQSRNNVITLEKDNAGFANYMDPIADVFFRDHVLPNCSIIREQYELGKNIVIYGEWCGENIQKNVAISNLPRMFVIFKIRVRTSTLTTDKATENETEAANIMDDRSFWIHPNEWSNVKWSEKLIFNIYDFPTYEIDIDFENPKMSQNKLIDLTTEVERECPVGKHFNSIGIGEGIVWTEWKETHGFLTFKVKGEKHSVSKVKQLAPVDTEKLASVSDFVEYACTENRMKQGLDYLREQQLTIEMKNIGTFFKWILNDIVKEEKDTMDASDINSKDISRPIQTKARIWFQNNLF